MHLLSQPSSVLHVFPYLLLSILFSFVWALSFFVVHWVCSFSLRLFSLKQILPGLFVQMHDLSCSFSFSCLFSRCLLFTKADISIAFNFNCTFFLSFSFQMFFLDLVRSIYVLQDFLHSWGLVLYKTCSSYWLFLYFDSSIPVT